MSNKNFKYIFVALTIFFSFFIGGKEVKAETCVFYSYEAGVYYDSSTGIYMPMRLTSGQTLEYKLKQKSGKNFILYVSSNTKFKSFDSTDFRDYIKNNGCPEYASYYYLGVVGGYESDKASKSDYKTYINDQYNGKVISESYDTFSVSYLSQKSYVDDGDKMYFTSVKTKYKDDIKLSAYSDEVVKEIQNALVGLDDKGKEYHYKETFYNQTKDLWFKAINYTYKKLKSSCNYTNKNSINRYEYLDLIDHDIFPTLMESGKVLSYQDALTAYSNDGFTSSTVSESCYNTIIYAKFMQEAFLEWFDLVDWLSLTKADDSNNFDTFSLYYEFAHLEDAGGKKVKEFRDALNTMSDANSNVDDLENANVCEMICEDNDTTAGTECRKSSTYTNCNSCITQCSHVGSAASYETCMSNCLEQYGLSYTELSQELSEYKEELQKIIEDQINIILTDLKAASAPTLSGVTFDNYKVECADVSFLHAFYNILRIIAPILVILFGTLDYTKSVMGADEQKIIEARKKLPKRLILLVLLILIPILINAILSLADIDTSLITCILNGE